MTRRGRGEGSIRERSDGRWEGTITVGYEGGKRVRKSVYGATQDEVIAGLLTIRQMQARDLPMPDDTRTVTRFLDEWIEHKEGRCAPRTYHSYHDTVKNHLKPRIGKTVLTKLTQRDLNAMYRAMRTDGKGLATIRYCRRVLSIALNDAMRWDYVSRNVAKLSEAYDVPETPMRVLTQGEAETFFAANADNRDLPLYLLAITTGLRQGELLGLRWDDVDIDARQIMVSHQLQRIGGNLVLTAPKSAKSRAVVYLGEIAVGALRRQGTIQKIARLAAGSEWTDSGFVFTTATGNPMDASNVVTRFHDSLTRAGLPSMRFHSLRHSCAMFLRSQGADLHAVKEALRHSQISVTSNFYGDLATEARRETAARMDGAFRTVI